MQFAEMPQTVQTDLLKFESKYVIIGALTRRAGRSEKRQPDKGQIEISVSYPAFLLFSGVGKVTDLRKKCPPNKISELQGEKYYGYA